MSLIRLLPSHLVDQIAAGEVIERPASALKELVENALDAGATQIIIDITDGGVSSVSVRDNGCGMNLEELSLAVKRHATSKLPGANLFEIKSFGFRGEALPSIAAVSDLEISSRTKKLKHGWKIRIEHGYIYAPEPVACAVGTNVSAKDLFDKIPARRKFLKTRRTEAGQCLEVVKQLAQATPDVSFIFTDTGKTLLNLPSRTDKSSAIRHRLSDVMGHVFAKEAVMLDAQKDGCSVSGLMGLPTMNRPTTQYMNVFVNQRPIKDKQLTGVVRAAYSDTLPKGRYPVIVLFISVSLENVDVNVHPAKSEVRFSNPSAIRSLIVGSIQSALRESGIYATAEGAQNMLNRLSFGVRGINSGRTGYPKPPLSNASDQENAGYFKSLAAPNFLSPPDMLSSSLPLAKTEKENTAPETNDNQKLRENLLGAARAQYHKNYIISETKDGIVIIDQHAAHERLVMEKMKADLVLNTIKTQLLLLPEIISLVPEQLEKIKNNIEPLNQLGLVIESFGDDAVIVRETPALLGEVNTQELIKDIAEELVHMSNSSSLEDRISHVLATISCHGSVRSGRILSVSQMNQLLRDMEVTPNSGQCNHGRPTFISLSLSDVERLFGRR